MPNTIEEEAQKLGGLLKLAISKVYAEEGLLANREGNNRQGIEQSIVFRVGIHLHELLKDSDYSFLDLDSEYNKYVDAPKTTSRFPKGIRPDLVLHRRGAQDDNKLAVEFKGSWNRNHENDIKKLEDLTSDAGPYKYTLGVMVLLHESAEYKYFQQGHEVELIN